MKLGQSFAVLAFFCATCLAQNICGIAKHGASADAIGAFEKIQDAVGIQAGTILLYGSSDPFVESNSGAVSVECPNGDGTEQWILYDPDLIKGDALYFALAHEIAHHLNHDPMSGISPSKQTELRADGFAARYLTRPPLNWTGEKLLQALNGLPLPENAIGNYPSLKERRAQVNASYAREFARLHPDPPPESSPRQSGGLVQENIIRLLNDLSGNWDIAEPPPKGVIKITQTSSGYVGTLASQTKDLLVKDTKTSVGKAFFTVDQKQGTPYQDPIHPSQWIQEYEISVLYYDSGHCRDGVPLNGLMAKVVFDGQEKFISFNAGFNMVSYRSSDRSCTLRRIGTAGSDLMLVQAAHQ